MGQPDVMLLAVTYSTRVSFQPVNFSPNRWLNLMIIKPLDSRVINRDYLVLNK